MPASTPKTILTTDRLTLRELGEIDAPFILRLLNEPSFIENIVDKGVRTLEQACEYINTGPVASYQQRGYGLYLIALKDCQTPIGMCGLVRREGLDFPDIGYALLPEHWSKGYAVEAASATLDFSQSVLGLKKIVGIANPDNESSTKVLEKIGLKYQKMIQVSEELPLTKYYVSE